MKMIFPFYECGMCHRPSNNQCEECMAFSEETHEFDVAQNGEVVHKQHLPQARPVKKIFVGSGEDAHLFQQLAAEGVCYG